VTGTELLSYTSVVVVMLKWYMMSVVVVMSHAADDENPLPPPSMPISAPPITYQLDRPGTSGKAVGPQLSIRDDDGTELPPGEDGDCV
jgi:hypothetical protein